MNKKQVYFVPFNLNKAYTEAYEVLFKNRIRMIYNPFRILILPFFSKVIIEDIHKFSWAYLIRLDLFLIHVPRGGGTFKIGWKETNPKLKIWIRLWRRNSLVICSKLFLDFFIDQEKIRSYQKIELLEEPIVSVNKESYCANISNPILNVLIMLGDRSSDNQYTLLMEELSGLYNVKISIHPRRKTELVNSEYLWNDIDLVIVDASVSITAFLQATGIRFLVLSDIKSSRKMWISKENLYSNMVDLEHLKARIVQGPYTQLKHKLSNKSLITKF